MTEPVAIDPRLELRAAKIRNSTRRNPGPPATDEQPTVERPADQPPVGPVEPLAPGVHHDVPADRYHADPALSSSDARQLLPPSCPARYRWTKDNGQPPRRVFDLGHAAHLIVLGAGDPLEVVDAADWRTKAAKEQRDDAHAAGRVPILAHEHQQVTAMASALRAHPIAGRLFQPGAGHAEVTLVWDDSTTGATCRARLDWLPTVAPGRRLVVADYKTAANVDPESLRRSMAQFGYHRQAAWYLDGCRQLGLGDERAGWVFVCQEKQPPYLVTVYEPDPIAMRVAAELNVQARHTWRWCTDTGRWPGYSDDEPLQLALPRWAEIEAGVHA